MHPGDQRLSNQGQIATAGWKEEATGVSAPITQSGWDREGAAEVRSAEAKGTDQKWHRWGWGIDLKKKNLFNHFW